jgi:hypothetical protein
VHSRILILAALLACATGLARVSNRYADLFWPARLNLAFGSLESLSAKPKSISFQAANPDSGQVSGSSPGSLTWKVSRGDHLQNWTLSVQSASSSFTGCPTVPVSAVQVSCGSASASGVRGTGVCGGSFPLSTTAQQIAGGAQGDGNGEYSVSMNFTLAESWRYVANSACTITLTYSVNAP